MNLLGALIMSTSILVVLVLFIYCLYKVYTLPPLEEELENGGQELKKAQ